MFDMSSCTAWTPSRSAYGLRRCAGKFSRRTVLALEGVVQRQREGRFHYSANSRVSCSGQAIYCLPVRGIHIACSHKHEDLSGPAGTWKKGQELKDYCTWGIGGTADFLVEVFTLDSLQHAIRDCIEKKLRYIVVGNGSNCLFDSRGFRGCVIVNKVAFKEFVTDTIIRVGSGYPFNLLGVECSRDGLSGLEFASGIPGSVGGAVFMNAGAGGQETSDCLESVEVLMVDHDSGTLQTCLVDTHQLEFSYRKSPFQEDCLNKQAIILSATFKLKHRADSRDVQRAYMDRRRKSQPLLLKSAGSVFQNPETGASAGALIDQSGLKGVQVGDAQVSPLHANFLVNRGSTSSSEMVELIALVKRQVERDFDVKLQEEVRYISPHGYVDWCDVHSSSADGF